MSKNQTIIPRKSWVLVKPTVDESRETENGLLLPATDEQEQKAQGVVVSVGEEIKTIKAGEKVVYGAYVGEDIKMSEDGKEVDYKLLLDDDIIALIK